LRFENAGLERKHFAGNAAILLALPERSELTNIQASKAFSRVGLISRSFRRDAAVTRVKERPGFPTSARDPHTAGRLGALPTIQNALTQRGSYNITTSPVTI
jgi:hypothetical protein